MSRHLWEIDDSSTPVGDERIRVATYPGWARRWRDRNRQDEEHLRIHPRARIRRIRASHINSVSIDTEGTLS